jgi:hypothetical protein
MDEEHRGTDTSCSWNEMEIVMSLPARNFRSEESMEARVSVLEAHYQHIQAHIQGLRGDVKEIRQEMNAKLDGVDMKFGELQKTLEAMNISRVWDRVWMLLSMGALLGVMARGFKWI